MFKKRLSVVVTVLLIGLAAALIPKSAIAQNGCIQCDELAYAIDNLVLLIAAIFVLFMQAGFAMVEAGFNSAKNTINILFKNLVDLSGGVLIFWLIGYNIMYPGDAFAGAYFGFGGIGVYNAAPTPGPGVLHPLVDWLFQAAFAATAATVVSGAVAGRMKFSGYFIYSVVLTALIYPVSGMWKWGGGWLDVLGFYDFAGSLVVHSVGGFAGLAGAMVLGPRIGRFDKETNVPVPSNMAIATLGVLILWIGWYGFNSGSQLAFSDAANVNATILIAANTTLSAAAGTIMTMLFTWAIVGKPDLSYTLNGALAGLVGITAGADSVSVVSAMIIGAVAGIIVVLGMRFQEAMHIDDPVGAWPVHGLCGIWGGIAVGIFGGYPLFPQLVGSLVIPFWAFVAAWVLFSFIKAIGLLRVAREDELRGLDVTEHRGAAYDVFTPRSE